MPINCQTCRDNLGLLLESPPEALAPATPAGAPDNVAGAMPSRIELQAHLAQCTACAREMSLLQNITATLRDLPLQTAPANFCAGVRARLQADGLQADGLQADGLQADGAAVFANEKGGAATPDVPVTPGVAAPSQPARRARIRWPDFLRQPARVAWAGGAVFTSLAVLMALASRGPESFQPAPELAQNEPFAADAERKAGSPPAPSAAGRTTKAPAVSAPRTKKPTENIASPETPRPTAGAMSAAPRQAAQATSAEAAAPGSPAERSEPEAQPLKTRATLPSPSTDAVRTTARSPALRRREPSTAEAVRPARFARLEIAQMPLSAANVGEANARAMGLPASGSAFSFRGGAMGGRAVGRGATAAGAAADASSEAEVVKAGPESQSRGGVAQGSAGPAPAAGLAAPRGLSAARARGEAPTRGEAPAPNATAPAPSGPARPSPAREAESSAPPALPASPRLSADATAPAAQRKSQNTRQDEALNPSIPSDDVRLGTAPPGAVRRTRLLLVLSRDAGQTRIRVMLPPGLRFVDGAANRASGTAGDASTWQRTRVVWTGHARRGQAIEIMLFFVAPPGPAAVRVAQESPAARAFPGSARGQVWKTINEQTVTVTIR